MKNVHILIIILFAISFSNFSAYSQESSKTNNLISDIDLQITCSNRAALFFKRNGYEESSQEFSTVYINHWNKKLGKCFIQITSTSLKDDFISIDIFDAIEGKRYAEYTGHIICDEIFTGDP